MLGCRNGGAVAIALLGFQFLVNLQLAVSIGNPGFFAVSSLQLIMHVVTLGAQSSCGTGRLVHVADLAPGGGGGGVGWPPWAAATLAARKSNKSNFGEYLQRDVFDCMLLESGLMDAGLPE